MPSRRKSSQSSERKLVAESLSFSALKSFGRGGSDSGYDPVRLFQLPIQSRGLRTGLSAAVDRASYSANIATKNVSTVFSIVRVLFLTSNIVRLVDRIISFLVVG
ncbi:hypothetical protein GWI33_020907 [Rhynchophorus ferrugineus]|uniref:Uncharacterized protein n=1 Tax=Rhynchophorus ferrugineus TaxID=354439 RepID=A0A834HRQ0_RHYFE|nr:hypothetical protein GWI33_020907 [Rhynchophorus ferrugineus]